MLSILTPFLISSYSSLNNISLVNLKLPMQSKLIIVLIIVIERAVRMWRMNITEVCEKKLV